jgi:hypothetical protein
VELKVECEQKSDESSSVNGQIEVTVGGTEGRM